MGDLPQKASQCADCYEWNIWCNWTQSVSGPFFKDFWILKHLTLCCSATCLWLIHSTLEITWLLFFHSKPNLNLTINPNPNPNLNLFCNRAITWKWFAFEDIWGTKSLPRRAAQAREIHRMSRRYSRSLGIVKNFQTSSSIFRSINSKMLTKLQKWYQYWHQQSIKGIKAYDYFFCFWLLKFNFELRRPISTLLPAPPCGEVAQ